MPRTCHFLGTKTRSGNKHTIRGKAKYLGGIGLKTTSITKRTFKPNLQDVRAVIDGKPVRIKASVKAIRMGLVTKPVNRSRTWTAKQKASKALAGLRPTIDLGRSGEPPVKGWKRHFSAKIA